MVRKERRQKPSCWRAWYMPLRPWLNLRKASLSDFLARVNDDCISWWHKTSSQRLLIHLQLSQHQTWGGKSLLMYVLHRTKDKEKLLWFSPAAKAVLPTILPPLHWALSTSIRSTSFMLAAIFIWLLTTYRFGIQHLNLKQYVGLHSLFWNPYKGDLSWTGWSCLKKSSAAKPALLASPVAVPRFVMSMLYIPCFRCVQKKTISCSSFLSSLEVHCESEEDFRK